MYNPIPNGTYEDIQGLRCWIPKPPARHLISGFDLPKKDQKWRRTELPEEWDEWRTEEQEKRSINPDYIHPKIERFVKQEWERRLYGYWFMLNGKATYITGQHYFYANFWNLDSGYPDYRDTDRKFFYFWQYCQEDPECYGMIEGTMRRQGKTYRGACIIYEIISRPPQKQHGGIQSKTASDASDLFSDKLIEAWKDLPDFFKPESNSGSDPKSTLSFFRDAKKGKAAKQVKQSSEFELRSTITWKPAKEKAYDGKALKILLHDECGKTNPKEEADVYKRLQIVKPCLLKNGEIWGKILLSSTVEELAEGGAQFLKIWTESNQYNREKHGGTKSGLYRYFLSALEGTFYDDFGFPDIEKARAYHEGQLEAKKDDPNDVTDYRRKFPFREADMFMAPADKCEFNAMILNEVRQNLQSPDFDGRVRQGDFIWRDEKQDTEVVFVENRVNGRWMVSYLPEKREDTNKILKDRGHFRPLNDAKFAISYDPFSHGTTVSGKRSNAASVVFRKFDPWVDNENNLDERGRVRWESHTWCADYLARPQDPEQAHEDILKACVFFGCQVLPENNKIDCVNYFKRRGYAAFIMNRPESTFTSSGQAQNTPGAPASRPMIDFYTNKLKSYVQNYGHLIKHIRVVRDLLVFNPKETEDYDSAVAAGWSMVALEKPVIERPKPLELPRILPSFNNRGLTSTRNV